MTLEELKKNNVDNIDMDVNDLDINNKIPSTEGNPIFDSTRTPIDNNTYNNGAERKVTPTTDNLDDIKVDRPLNVVQTGPVDMNSEMTKFDIDSLPKKRDSTDDFKDELTNQLDSAISRKMDEIDEISEVGMRNLKAEFDRKRDNKILRNNDTTDDFDFNNSSEYSPEQTVVYENYEGGQINMENGINLNSENETMVDVESVEVVNIENKDSNDSVINEVEQDSDPIVTVDDTTDTVDREIDNEKNVAEITLDGFFDDSDSLEKDIDEESINNADYDNRSDDEIIDELKTSVKSVVKQKKIDLSKFTVSKNTISTNNLNFGNDSDIADWYLPNSKSVITVKGLTGSEIIMLNPANSSRNRINAFKDVYSTIYKHILDPNKGTFEEWMKNTRYSDIQHIYFALYRATFYGSNFVHYQCPHCHRSFVKNNVSFDDLVKYANDDVKRECEDAMKKKMSRSVPYKINRVAISDEIVADVREPSVWNAVIEMTSLSDDFIEAHSDLVNNIVAIDKMYKIDVDNQLLIPISENPVDRNLAQTILNKIKAYKNVTDTLSSDDYFKLKTEIANVMVDDNTIKYLTPECECEYCHSKIPETEMDASELLFTRHQLGALAAL